MNHTHEYGFWHAHGHDHYVAASARPTGTGRAGVRQHDTGHYHSWAQTHDHGKSGSTPHTHRARQAHPGVECKHHHATMDHERAV